MMFVTDYFCYLQNFINVVSMSLPNSMFIALCKDGLEMGARHLTDPTFTIEFHSKHLVICVFNDLTVALFHYSFYCVPFDATGTEIVFQKWQEALMCIFSVTTQ